MHPLISTPSKRAQGKKKMCMNWSPFTKEYERVRYVMEWKPQLWKKSLKKKKHWFFARIPHIFCLSTKAGFRRISKLEDPTVSSVHKSELKPVMIHRHQWFSWTPLKCWQPTTDAVIIQRPNNAFLIECSFRTELKAGGAKSFFYLGTDHLSIHHPPLDSIRLSV